MVGADTAPGWNHVGDTYRLQGTEARMKYKRKDGAYLVEVRAELSEQFADPDSDEEQGRGFRVGLFNADDTIVDGHYPQPFAEKEQAFEHASELMAQYPLTDAE